MPRAFMTRMLLLLPGIAAWNAPASAQLPTVIPGFTVTLVADSLPVTGGIAIAPASFDAHAGDVFLVATDSNKVVRVTPAGGRAVFATGLAIYPAQLSFGPGGAFGTSLYVSCNQDPSAPSLGAIWRVSSSAQVTYFGSQTPSIGFKFGGGGFAFSASGPFGEFIYTGASGGDHGDCISRIGSGGNPASLFNTISGDALLSYGTPMGFQFGPGPSGFGSDLYFAYWHTVGGTGLDNGLYKLNSGGGRTAFSPVFHPAEIEFAPGGAFGRSLYVAQTDFGGGSDGRILRVDSTGVATVFISGIPRGAFGLAFADTNALYFNAAGTVEGNGRLYRVVRATAASAPPALVAQTLKLGVRQSPVAGEVSFEWSTAQAGSSHLFIATAAGRRIRRILTGPSGPGIQHATWDGRDDAGRVVGAGVYFASIVNGGSRSSCRIVLAR